MANPYDKMTTVQLAAAIDQLSRRLFIAEKRLKNLVVDDDSGSFQSLITSNTGGKGSLSGSFSGDYEHSELKTGITSGTGSDSYSLAEPPNLPGA